jgi:hypothetical protein
MGYKKIIPKHPGANSSNMTFVGIAETDPKVNLDVNGNVRVQDAHSLMFGRNGDDYAWRIRNESAQDNSTYGFTSTNTLVFEVVSDSGKITGSGSPPPLDTSHGIYTTSTNALVLLETGRVGIGTNAPTARLHISTDSGSTKNTTVLQLESYLATVNEPDYHNYQELLFDGGTTHNKSSIRQISNGWATGNSGLTFHTSLHGGSSNVERIRILGNGNVGVGTTDPNTRLDVYSSAAGNISRFYDGGSNGGAMYNGGAVVGISRVSNGSVSLAGPLFQVGKDTSSSTAYNIDETLFSVTNTSVGVGTLAPAAKLHVYNNAGGDATDKATMLSEAVLKLQPHATNSTNMLFAQVDNGSSMGIQVTNGPATANWDLSLNPFGGGVGIGTVAPASQLHIKSVADVGDAILTIEADADDNVEHDNPQIHFLTDGGLRTAAITGGNATNEGSGINANALNLQSQTIRLMTSSTQDFDNATERMRIESTGQTVFTGNVVPDANGSRSLGTSSVRWGDIYTSDLHLSNEAKGPNEIDGTTGNWTVQEGEEHLYIVNNKSGKKYKFALEEIE